MYCKNVTVQCPNHESIKVLKESFVLVDNDSLLAFELDDRLISLLKNELKGQINGINLMHLTFEKGIKPYTGYLEELINYIIFKQQNEIVSDQLFILNKKQEFGDITQEIIKKTQRKISKNDGELFPTEDTAEVADPASFHLTFMIGKYYYYGHMNLEVSTVNVPLNNGDPIDLSGDICYDCELTKESSSSNGSGASTTTVTEPEITDLSLISTASGTCTNSKLLARGYDKVEIREKWTQELFKLDLKKFYQKTVSAISCSAEADVIPVTITKLVNPHYYDTIPDL